MATEAKLEPGWLDRQMKDIESLGKANRKILEAAKICRSGGYTQPYQVTFTIPELNALAYMVRMTGVLA